MTRILVIDDDLQTRDVLRQMLERAGYEVVEAGDGREGVQSFRTAPADLVITDQTMPHMSDEALSYELRCLCQDIPIILCTGFNHVMTPEKAQRLGVDAFCMKPLRIRDLSVMIRHVLAQRAARES